MFHTSLLKITDIEPNTPDKNTFVTYKGINQPRLSLIYMTNRCLPRLILWLDKFMPSTSASQKSLGSLCLKIPGRAGFDYPVVGWWMYA